MAQRLFIPKLGHTMTEGIIAKWFKQSGDCVSAGDVLYELEYDKATETIEAEKAGELKILINEGETAPVGETVGVILEAGDDLEKVLAQKVRRAYESRTQVNIPTAAYSMAHAAAIGETKANGREKEKTDAYVANKEEKFDTDLLVIGGGPGGYVAAIRAAQQGLKVTLVEKDKLGGTCLNKGCIPTKALIRSAEVFNTCRESADYGVITNAVTVDIGAVFNRKENVVSGLINGVSTLLKARGIQVVKGTASFETANSVLIKNETGSRRISARNVIIASGSIPSMPPIAGIDGINVLTSNEALDIKALPDSMVIIGGGVIGMELGCAYAALGSKVTVIEAMDNILSVLDNELGSALLKYIGESIKIVTGRKVISIADIDGAKKVTCTYSNHEETYLADAVLITVGRKADIGSLALDKAGIRVDKGYIEVDENFMTNVPGIYCIGDANGKKMLAHAASAQGIDAVDIITGRKKENDNRHNVIPSCVYTIPEIGSVGKSEEELRAENVDYKVCKFNLRANGRAMVMGDTRGFVKILADKTTDEILGIHIIGGNATELIGECALAIRMECTLEELADTIHAHPTVSESIMEAAEAGIIGAIHSL